MNNEITHSAHKLEQVRINKMINETIKRDKLIIEEFKRTHPEVIITKYKPQ